MTTSKYNNKPVWYDPDRDLHFPMLVITKAEAKREGWVYFPSQLEYEVFRAVRAWFAARRLKFTIDFHHTITILPKTESIKPITWCVDLMVSYSPNPAVEPFRTLYIESKGVETDDFKLKMNLMNRFKPELMKEVRIIRHVNAVSSILSIATDERRYR
jgi:hypothetical protein